MYAYCELNVRKFTGRAAHAKVTHLPKVPGTATFPIVLPDDGNEQNAGQLMRLRYRHLINDSNLRPKSYS